MFGRLHRGERLFAYGQYLAEQERFDEAIAAYERALALRPGAPGIALHKALAWSEIGRQDEAITMMRQAMAHQPDNPVLPMFLGQILFDHGNYAAARTWCRRALDLNPSNTHAQALAALTDLAQENITAGCQRLLTPLCLETADLTSTLLRALGVRLPLLVQQTNTMLQSRLLLTVEAYLLKHAGLSRSLGEQLVGREQRGLGYTVMYAIDLVITRVIMTLSRGVAWLVTVGRPSPRAVKWKRLAADEAYYLGKLEVARARYTELPSDVVADPAVQERLYDICYELGDFRAALKHLRHTEVTPPERGPRPTWYARQLGELLYLNGRYGRATTTLLQATEGGDREYRSFYYLALCKLRQGKTKPARRLFALAVQQLHPGIAPLRLQEALRVHGALAASETQP